jgi:hypothetical protein
VANSTSRGVGTCLEPISDQSITAGVIATAIAATHSTVTRTIAGISSSRRQVRPIWAHVKK